MMRTLLLTLVLALFTQGGDAGITAKFAIGEVKTVDAAAKQLTIKTDAGTTVTVAVTDKTSYKRLAPGETSLTNAADITLADVSEGDRIMARGTVDVEHKSVPALQVIVMTKGDLAKKQEAERAEWRRRGIAGVISSLRPETKEITIAHRAMGGTQSIVMQVGDKTEMRRYAPDSIKFTDAKPGNFGELKVGDQLRDDLAFVAQAPEFDALSWVAFSARPEQKAESRKQK